MPPASDIPALPAPSRAWIGLDATGATPRAAWAALRGGRLVRGLVSDAASVATVRPDGRATSLSVPADRASAERIALPGMPWSRAARLLPGQLDLRLPMPVESCLVAALPDPAAREPSFLAFAVPKADAAAAISSAAFAFGVRPERLVPAAAALWRKAVADVPRATGACAFHLHAGVSGWTLLAGEGVRLDSSVPIPAGDCAAVARNVAILALRAKLPASTLTISGDQADDGLVASLKAATPALPCKPLLLPAPADFLALALAEEGALAGRSSATDGAFPQEGGPHPAAARRELRRALGLVALPLLCAAAFLAAGLRARHAAREALAYADGSITAAAEGLAGRRLPLRGPAALEFALNEFDQRIHPAVALFASRDPFEGFAIPFQVSLTRRITIASASLQGRTLRFEGLASSEGDFAVWRKDAEGAGQRLAIESDPPDAEGRIPFRATQFPKPEEDRP